MPARGAAGYRDARDARGGDAARRPGREPGGAEVDEARLVRRQLVEGLQREHGHVRRRRHPDHVLEGLGKGPLLDDLVVLEEPEITLKGWCNADTTCAAPDGRSFTVRDLFDAIEKHEARNWQGPGYMDFHYFAGLKKEAAFGASVYAVYWNMS